MTWSEVLIHAVQDGRCWDREVRRPAVGFLTRGTERSFSDCETNSQCLLMGSPASQRKPRRICQQVNQHQNMERKGNGKGGRQRRQEAASHQEQTAAVRHHSGTAPRSASALLPAQTATHAPHGARKNVRKCVREACSLTETTQRPVQRGEQVDYLPSPRRHQLQVRQTVCLRLFLVRVLPSSSSLEKGLSSHKPLPTSRVGKRSTT